jgi:hypothetical protein
MSARATWSHVKPFTAAIHALAARSAPACLVDLEGTVLFLNDAWDRFARDSAGGLVGEATVGALLVDGLQGDEPRRIVRALFEGVVQRGVGGQPVAVTAECNGPDVARLVTTQVGPVGSGDDLIGLTVQHRVVRERPVAEVYPVVDGGELDYHGRDGVLEQCSCCRRTRRPDDESEWDFVPGLVAAPPADALFTYCPLCRALHHPAGAPEEEGSE